MPARQGLRGRHGAAPGCRCLAALDPPPPPYPCPLLPCQVMIYDDHQGRAIGELSFRNTVRTVRLRKDRIAVALEHKVGAVGAAAGRRAARAAVRSAVTRCHCLGMP